VRDGIPVMLEGQARSLDAQGLPSGRGMNDYTVLVPARMASSRLPNKPMADINACR
jgi:hypothetical protein